MVPLAIAPGELATALRGLAAAGLLGASVTVPHKEAAARACDARLGVAAELGVVNCLRFDGGAIHGHNTDAGGFVDSLVERGWAPAGRAAIVLGAGGAARAVAAGLREAGARLTVVARRPEAAAWATSVAPWTEAALADLLAAADLVVDCTDAALDPDRDAAMADTVPLAALPAHALVASLVYHRRPALLARAAARALATLDGRAMLVHQGARAFTLWTGAQAPIAAMRAALDAALLP
jgi:shikimate dehydrogenase